MRNPVVLGALAVVLAGCSGERPSFPWQDPKLSPEKRAADRLSRMSREEKIGVLSGKALRTFSVPAGYPPGLTAAASWDPGLVEHEARAVAHEALRNGAFQVLGPDLGGFGEDNWLSSRMGIAFVEGVQAEGIIATPRLFPSAWQDERVLREANLPAFRAAVEESGAWALTTAGASRHLLIDILRTEWGFKGFVVSDGSSGSDGAAAAEAGVDVGMADPGRLRDEVIDEKVRLVLRALFASGALDPHQVVVTGSSAERAGVVDPLSAEGVVLLKNEANTLPFDGRKVGSIAVIGKGGLEGIRERAGTTAEARLADGEDVEQAVALARKSGAAVVRADDSRAGDLIRAVANANRKTVVVLTKGPQAGAERWASLAPAIVCAWQPAGITPVLFGDVNPSGRLPVTYAKEMRPEATGLYSGYRYFDKQSIAPLYPFGYGLSYTSFEYSDLRIFPATPRYGETVNVVLKVSNAGSRAGSEVVQLYLHQRKPNVERPPVELKGFRRVELQPGRTATVSFVLDRRSIWFYDPSVKDWVTQPGVYEVLLGSNSRDVRVRGSFELFP